MAETLDESQTQLFIQQHAGDLQAQRARADVLANESFHQVQADLPRLFIPPNASAQLRAFLTAQDQFERAQVALHNQYCAGSSEQLEAAMTQWQQDHADQISRLNQLAIALSQSTQNQ